MTGGIDHIYTSQENRFSGDIYVVTATDYDLSDDFEWSSYTITNEVREDILGVAHVSSVAILDDGTMISHELKYFDAFGGFPVRYKDIWEKRDENGNLDYVYSATRVYDYRASNIGDLRSESFDYDPETGHLDYSFVVHFDGREESIDYNIHTNQRDYGVVKYTNGRVVAHDYNADTGLLDYVITTDPDGRSLAQDYGTPRKTLALAGSDLIR